MPLAYVDELREAFSTLGRKAEFIEGGKLKDPLRVLAYKQPRERNYVFSPYPALDSDIDTSPRDVDVLFDGRLSEPGKIKDAWRALPGRIYKLCLNVALTLESSGLQFDEVVDKALLDMGCLSELPEGKREYLIGQVNIFMAALRGFNMLKELLDAGIKVFYYGAKSYCSLYKHPNLVIDKTVRSPKILLYAHPFLAYGSSRRLLSAMGGGTVTATDANGFMNDNFPEMIIYDNGNFTEKVARLLEQPDELTRLCSAVRNKVLDGHMPCHRAKQILFALEISGRTEVSLYE